MKIDQRTKEVTLTEAEYYKLVNSPVSEKLEEAAWQYYDRNKPLMPPELDLHKELIDFFMAGAKWQITKLMKDATDVTVHIDAGGYPYTPEIELYDYDKDVPLAKEGDKYKVILIKEE